MAEVSMNGARIMAVLVALPIVVAAPNTAVNAAAPPSTSCVPAEAFGHWLVSAANAGGVNDAGDNFGAASAVGDFNGDGFGDVAVGAPQDAVGGVRSGAVFVFPGSSGGIGAGIRLTQSNASAANEAGDEFGAALVAGDFNRDGRADLAVGVPGEAIGTASDSGAVVVFAGTPAGLSSGVVRDQAPSANEAGDRFGQSLAVGDLNGDSYPDLAAGTPGEAPGSQPAGGVVFLFNGSAGGLVAAGYRRQEDAGGGTEAGDQFGKAVAAGDVSGDGVADLVVGAPNEAPNAEPAGGTFFVLPGGAAGLTGGYYRIQENGGGGTEAGDAFGAALAVADFNGDGVADIAVGTPNEAPGSSPAGGVVFVFRGVRGAVPTGYFLTQVAGGGTTEAGDGFGAALAAADTDRDGYAELLAGAPSDRLGAGPRSGSIMLFGGGPRSPERARRISEPDVGSGDETGDRFGAALAAGDVTGDGRPDVVAGTPGEAIPGQPASGVVTLVSGLAGAVSIGPLTGAASPTTARIWARGARPGTLRVQYRVAGTSTWTLAPATATFNASLDHTGVVTVSGLSPSTNYEYRLVVDCVADPLSDGKLRTAANPSTGGRARFAYGADIAGPPYAGFTNVTSKNPDFMIFGGDNLYADAAPAATTTAEYNAKYRDQWGEAFFRQFVAGTSGLLMWDDHEIRNDWSSGQTGLYLQARPAFNAYQGGANPPPRTAGNTYFTHRTGPIDLYVMDNRSHRSPNSAPDNSSKTMLGATQKADVKAWLSSSTAPFKFLVSSVPWNNYGTTGSDSWRGFTTERAELFNYIRNNNIRGVVLISGDQHWSGAFRMTSFTPYRFYEFMPTPIFVGNRPMPPDTNPEILFKDDTHKVFAVFDVDATVSPARLTVEYFDTNTNASLYRLTITQNDILP
jgi:phosphodiesterase/alkaline phosphatase D-like protein